MRSRMGKKNKAIQMATRYKRAMAPLDAKARARLWYGGRAAEAIAFGCDGPTTKLEELVRAFYSDEICLTGDKVEKEIRERETPAGRRRRVLEAELKDDAAGAAAEWLRRKAEAAVGGGGLECEELLRRRLVRRMRERGVNAGICKSQWDTASGVPAGSHEYVDAIVGDTRYIVEINLAGEFNIARPTEEYLEVLGSLPKVFVGRPGTLEAVIRLMCLAAQESIRKAGMHVPPWRRRKYMNEKWFGDYRRYTDTSSAWDSKGRTSAAAYTANQRCGVNSGGAAGRGEWQRASSKGECEGICL